MARRSGIRVAVLLSVAGSVITLTSLGAGVAGAGARTAVRPGMAPGRLAAVSLKSWGDNTAGELGDGTAEQSDAPVGVGNLSRVAQVSAGDRFTLALLANGTVRAWGNNADGQLGDGTTISRDVPVTVKGLSGVRAVSAGGEHSLALLSDGTVMAWGDNQQGQLGTGTTRSSDVPVPVPGLSGVTAISAGYLHSLALLATGTVEAWGYGLDGQLGDGKLASSDAPVAVHGLRSVSAVAAGGQFSLALLADGTVRAWGDGEDGQLGDGGDADGNGSDTPVPTHHLTRVVAISAGYSSALAQLSNRTAMAWGDTGLTETASFTPIRVPLHGVTAVSAGGRFDLVLLTSGTVDVWGADDEGELGNGTSNGGSSTPAAVPHLTGVRAISAGDDHAVAALPAAPPVIAPRPVSMFTVTPAPDPRAIDGLYSDPLTSVSAASANDALAVGPGQLMATAGQGLFAEHWNGSRWQVSQVPAPKGRFPALEGVADIAPGDGWAVGYSSADDGCCQDQTLIEHWNGTTWAIVPSPDPAGSGGTNTLHTIAAVSPTDIWAAGSYSSDDRPIRVLFEHYNGTAWNVVPSDVGGFAFGLAAITSSDVWMSGTTGAVTSGLLSAHWNGRSWQTVPTPATPGGPLAYSLLTAVTAVSPADVWASGYVANVHNQNFQDPLVLRWNGKKWSLTLIPNPGNEGSQLRGITALGPGDIWAVGYSGEDEGSLLSLTEQFNGKAWTPQPSPDPGEIGPNIDNVLNAAASADGRLWVVGTGNHPGQCCSEPLAIQTSSS